MTSHYQKNSSSHASTGCFIERVQTKGRQSKTLLQSMELTFPPNCITAILGPSGSGKTTLLSLLTGTLSSNLQAYGRIHLPGHTSFVPQDDRLHGFFTCKSYLHHYARLSGLASQPGIGARIDTLLRQLGLADHAGTIVGDLFLSGLSGGQKRRLSIALEALSSPQNFILDEITSGLDAESALQVMDFLHEYASEGRRVILTIHQPSSFIWEKIDSVVLLSKGDLMYNGPRTSMEDFFSQHGSPTPKGWNPADHYVTVVNDEFRDHTLSVQEWSGRFNEWNRAHAISIQQEGATTRSPSTARSGSPLVVFELVYRYFLNLFFNPGILFTRIAMYTMLAGMIGALFYDLGNRRDFESVQARAAVLFYAAAFFIFMTIAVLPFTVIEKGIVDKEAQNGYYHPIMYQIAQGLSSIPGCAVLALVVSLLIVGLLKLRDPYWFFLDMFLSLLVAEALAQLVSHIVPHFVIGMALLAGLYGFFMLFQGFMLVPSDFPDYLKWTYYTGPQTYAWRTFMVTEFRGANETFSGPLPTGEDVLRFFEIEDVNRERDMFILLAYAGVVHMLSFCVLIARHHFFRGTLMPPTRQAKKPAVRSYPTTTSQYAPTAATTTSDSLPYYDGSTIEA